MQTFEYIAVYEKSPEQRNFCGAMARGVRRIELERKRLDLVGEARINNSFCICVVQNLRMLFDKLFMGEGKGNITCYSTPILSF